MIWSFYIYVAAALTAFLFSLKGFRRGYPPYFKLISALLGLPCVAELAAFILRPNGTSDASIQNALDLVDIPAYAWFFYQLIPLKTPRKIILVFLFVYPVAWVILMLFKFDSPYGSNNAHTWGSLILFLFSLMYLFQRREFSEKQKKSSLPEFWIVIALLILNLKDFTYLYSLNELQYPSLFLTVWWMAIILTKMFFIYAFWLLKTPTPDPALHPPPDPAPPPVTGFRPVTSKNYDIFLSYNTKDRAIVLRTAEALTKQGINSWYDIERIPQGASIHDSLGKAMSAAKIVAIFWGRHGKGSWQAQEIDVAIGLRASKGILIIPILLYGTTADQLPIFLQSYRALECRSEYDSSVAVALADSLNTFGN